MKKELLFIASTHGDEKIGIEVLTRLESSGFHLDWIIGNKEAAKRNLRYLECDLNRVAPGKAGGAMYEERRAFEVLNKTKKYKRIIDIHGSTARCGIFALITNPSIDNLAFATTIPVKNVVVWIAKKIETINPLSEYFSCGLELECGPKESLRVEEELMEIIKSIINRPTSDKKQKKQKFYQVYGRVEGVWDKKIKDFKKIKLCGESFYPILSSQYKGVKCYKMRKLDLFDILSY